MKVESPRNTNSGCSHQRSLRDVAPNPRTIGKLVGAEAMPGSRYGHVASGFLSGERGIRTLGTLTGTPVFETGPINHSGISPGSSDPAISYGRDFGAARW